MGLTPEARLRKLERARKWRKLNKERRELYRQAYIKAHPEQTRAMKRGWYMRHREEVVARTQKYREVNLERLRAYDRKRNKEPGRIAARLRKSVELRKAVLDAYGHSCQCCGEANELMLTIDHVNNDGAEHRRNAKFGSWGFYGWLIRNNFPAGFQTLCFGCNWSKHRNGGICPHAQEVDVAFSMIGAC